MTTLNLETLDELCEIHRALETRLRELHDRKKYAETAAEKADDHRRIALVKQLQAKLS